MVDLCIYIYIYISLCVIKNSPGGVAASDIGGELFWRDEDLIDKYGWVQPIFHVRFRKVNWDVGMFLWMHENCCPILGSHIETLWIWLRRNDTDWSKTHVISTWFPHLSIELKQMRVHWKGSLVNMDLPWFTSKIPRIQDDSINTHQTWCSERPSQKKTGMVYTFGSCPQHYHIFRQSRVQWFLFQWREELRASAKGPFHYRDPAKYILVGGFNPSEKC